MRKTLLAGFQATTGKNWKEEQQWRKEQIISNPDTP